MQQRNLYLFLTLLALPFYGWGKAPEQDLFAKGNAFYAKAKYQDAAKTYQQLLDSGYQSSVLYFNLANALYRLDEIPSAILYYEKAQQLAPGDEDIQVNLQLANLKITDKIEAVPEFFLSKWRHSAVMVFSLQTWAVIGSLFFVVGFILLSVYLFALQPGLKKASFYGGVVLLVLALFSLAIAKAQDNYFNDHRHAIVFNGTVNVKSAPGDAQKTLFVIHEGTKVGLLEQNGDWIKVALPNGNIGWIGAAAVKTI